VSERPSNALLWFGVIGGATAWTIQFVANLAFTWARCNPPVTRWQLPVHAWEIGLSIGALAVGFASWAVSLKIFLRTRHGVADLELRGMGSPPPVGRINFLAIMGLLVNFLALAIIVLTGIGAPMLHVCQQS
jgi:hypothetical protein